ncbi:MAG: ABC transporter ATP-binding protein [Saprospiraceae bacterium]|jgi:ATP-binding cassette subfamily B multidrug efflux pump|nr:ABC transporter ATP-binding protein [Saprospiraceae bacterium]MDG2419386.1 ABC transporter ATP-binding protein [Saprospiraceae bacterium]
MNKNKIDYLLLGRVLALAKPYRKVFILAGILTALLAPLAILRPYIIKIMVDDYIFKFDIPGLTNMAMLLGFILMIEVALRYVFIYSTSWLGQSVIKDLRVRMFNHISSLRLSYFDTTPIGTSTTRTINDIETINTVFSQGAITIIADLFTVFAVLTIMLITSWKLTLVCLTTLPFLMIATYIFKEKVKISYQKVRTQITRMNAFLQERISGMRIVQVFNAEEKELEKFKNINRKYTQANLDAILYYAVFFPVVEIISAAALGLLVWWGARGVIGGEVTTGTFIAFPIYLSMLFRPIRMLADRFNTLQMGLVASERVFNLLDKNDIIENNGTIKKESIAGDVEFDNVSFAYNNIDHVLNNLNFKINAGETLAICGSTGSGKTTIINILNRFYDIQKGKILIDDVNIRDYELFDLRKKIAIVLQDVFLFSGSVMENITLRDDRISEKEVIDAAKLIGAHEFIERLPSGYNYQVMERGATLSMGQRQLISFVRALVFNPDILILDEATSSIDPESESVIQYAIEKLIDKRTSIIIAHRLSTIRHADNIMVLNKGEIVELGAHDALIEIENGQYKELYEMQFMQLES